MNSDEKRIAVRERLAALGAGGRLTPETVVADARDEDSPLHGLFEWNDGEAAHHYRIGQARRIMRVKYVFSTETREILVPQYVRDPEAADGEQGYVPTAAVASDKDRARSVLVSEAGRAAARLRRVRDLSAAFDLEGEMDAILNEFGEFRRALAGE